MAPSSSDVTEARALHARAQELAAEHDYREAVDLCRRALKLHDDPEIRATYRRLLATIGPY